MGLYNIIHGHNPGAGNLLSLLEIPEKYPLPPRYRDCWHEKTEEEKYAIVVLARQGGGNRDCYAGEYNQTCEEMGCYHLWNENIAKHPLFISDKDGYFPEKMDSTYNFITFDAEDFKPLLMYLEKDKPDLSEEAFMRRIEEIVSDIQNKRETPLDGLVSFLAKIGEKK